MNQDFEKSNLFLDGLDNSEEELFLKKRKTRRYIYWGVFIVISIYSWLLNQMFQTSINDRNSSYFYIVLACLIWGLFLGLIFSLIPVGGSTYKKRYLNTSLFVACIISFLMAIINTLEAFR